jgi:pentatricopeptide repeat protein
MSATMPAVGALAEIWSFLVSARLELMMFFAAMVVYAVLNMHRIPKKGSQKHKSKVKLTCDALQSKSSKPVVPRDMNLNSYEEIESSMQIAIDDDDHGAVLKCWNAAKRFDNAPIAKLPRVLESMQICKKDHLFIVQELKAVFSKLPNQATISVVNDLLEALGRRLDSQLMEQIVQILPSLGLEKNDKTYEIFLLMQLSSRNFEAVLSSAAEMKETGIPFTTRALVSVIKAALRTSNFAEAVQSFRKLKAEWANHKCSESPSQAPQHIVSQLVELACKERQLRQFLPELKGAPIAEDAVNSMLTECIRIRDGELVRSVEELARAQDGDLSDASYSLLLKAIPDDDAHARAIIQEVASRKNKTWSPDLLVSVLAFCSKTADVSLADQLFEQLKPHPFNVLSSFIRFYLDCGKFSRACDIFEQDMQPLNSGLDNPPRGLMVDARMERSLLSAALRCGRTSLATKLLESSPSDVAKHISMIQNCASENNLPGAFEVFESLKRSGVDLNSVVYNTVLEACVQCHNYAKAEMWMEATKAAGMADVVSYNTLIKAHLLDHKPAKARSLMDEMKQLGLQPNRVTYNELINSLICGRTHQRDEVWDIVREMKAAGIAPNQVTCSILLKTLNARSSAADVTLTMDLMNTMEEQMDEVLLSSVVEACVRIGKPDLLAAKLIELQSGNKIAVNGAHTFGSLIKAYGHARDVNGVWRCWQEMRSRHVKPSSITVGCMVEAVVSNGDTEGAYDLIQQVQDDEECRSVLNSVIYCSVLKGFAREKKLDRVRAVYEEMCKRNIDMSVVMFNTIIDACARVGRMEYVVSLLGDMKGHGVKPNLITYSTMVKGHCQSGDVQSAFTLLEQMKRETNLKPDEIMYNSLLDGCAQQSLVDEGQRLLDEMQAGGVQPSNFTLSVLVKLMNRARRLDKAFSLVQEISQKYNFRPNVHVYTNLIQACISNRQLNRAMETLEVMIKDKAWPESRTYMLLVRAHMSSNQPEQAVALLRGALGLSGAHRIATQAACPNLEHGLVNETLSGLADRGLAQQLAVPLLNDIKVGKHRVNVDASVQRRVTCASAGDEKVRGVPPTKGKGRGLRSH